MAITRSGVSEAQRSVAGTDASITHTVVASTTLLVVSTMHEAAETVTATPSWSGDGTPQDLTLIHATTSSGNQADVAMSTYALASPTVETAGTVTVTHSSNDNSLTTACNYLGTHASATMAENMVFIQEDVNDTATDSCVFASAGVSGATLYAAGVFKGDDGNDDDPTSITVPTNFSALFANALRSGTSANADVAGYVCDFIGGGAASCTWTWDVTDENAGHYLQIAVAGAPFETGGATPAILYYYTHLLGGHS